MKVSVLINGGTEQALIGSAKWILNQVKLLRYDMENIEVIFLVQDAIAKDTRKWDGDPVVKVKYFLPEKGFSYALFLTMQEASGDLIMLADIDAFFKQDDLLYAVVQLRDIDCGLVIGPKHIVFRKNLSSTLPVREYKCFKCQKIISCAINGKDIYGQWGRMHRSEIALQFKDIISKANLLTKIKLAWKYISGV